MKTPGKTIVLIILSCLVFNLIAQDRTPKTPDERATAITNWMKTNLQLTADQEPSIQGINLKYANLNEELRSSTKSKTQKFKTLKANDENKDRELKGVLSPDQFRIYETKKDELKEKFKEEAKERRKENN